jgi:23S rRNA (pseudouridine1915-N3)-methyltransferase
VISLVTLGSKPRTDAPASLLRADYLQRIQRFGPAEAVHLGDEAAWARWSAAHKAASAWRVLLDSRGRSLTSDALAQELGTARDTGRRHMAFAIGPADGWTPGTLASADLVLSLGAITLPHELAAVVLAEQVYRALTILAGHPYHLGHR